MPSTQYGDRLRALASCVALLGLACTGSIGASGAGTGTATGTGIGTGTGASTGTGTGSGTGMGGAGTGTGTGATGGAGAPSGTTGAGGTGGTGANAGGAGSTGSAGSGITGTGGAPLPPDPNAAGLLPLRRLTSREYLNTVFDLLGDNTLTVDDVPNEGDDSEQQRVSVPAAERHWHARRRKLAGRGRAARQEHLHQVVDGDPLHPREHLGRGGLRQPVHHHVRAKGLPAAADHDRGHQPDHSLPDGAYDAGARLQRGDRPAHRGDAPVAGLRLPLGARSGRRDQGGERRPARQLSGGEPTLLFPVGDNARRGAVRGGGRRTAVDRDGHPDPGPADVAGRQGAGHGRRLHRRLARRQRDLVAAEGSQVLRHVEPGSRDRHGERVSRLRRRDGSRHRALRGPAHGNEVVGHPGAGDRVWPDRRHRHDPQGGDAEHRATCGRPDAGGVPDRDRRDRWLVPGAARARRLHPALVPDASQPARQRAAAAAADAGPHHPAAVPRPRPERLHRHLPQRHGFDWLRVRALRRHRAIPDHRSESPGRLERLDRARRPDADVHRRARPRQVARGEQPGPGLLRDAVDAVRAQPVGHGRRRRLHPIGDGDVPGRPQHPHHLITGVATSRTFRYRAPAAGEILP